MDDLWSSKPTSLRRPSKLPMPGGQSKLPTPKSIRPSPSMGALSGGSSGALGVAAANSSRNAKLRLAPSRDRLAVDAGVPAWTQPTSSTSSSTSTSTRTVSSSQVVSGQATTSLAKPTASSGVSVSPAVSVTRNPQRLANGQSVRSSPAQPRCPRIGGLPTGLPSSSSAIGQSSRLPSRVQPSQCSQPSGQSTSTDRLEAHDGHDAAALQHPDLLGTFRPMTLTERTIETLSTLPSSPAVRGKGAASFYDGGSGHSRATSQPRSRASRLSSNQQSDGSSWSRGPSRYDSRPGSSSGADEAVSNFRATLAAYRPAMSPVDGTPRGRASTGSSVVSSATRITAGGTIRGLRSKLSTPSLIGRPRPQTPSPGKGKAAEEKATARFGYGSRTVTAGPARSRPSLNGLFKKPSMPALDKTTAMGPPRKLSLTSVRSSATSNEGTNLSVLSCSSSNTALTMESPDVACTNRKSSAALREQIAKAKAAKAKAAKREAARELAAPQTKVEQPRSPLIPVDASFDFGLAPDPFNQGRDANSQAKVLQGRLASARTSGRLNIAAMGLREIPAEVLNMYNLESFGSGDASWAESVDLSRFVAADNELEMIDESVFPDVDPHDFADDEESQGNMFGGLETLDLHGNMLISLPIGLRRLPFLTLLNLASNRLANNCLQVISRITPLRDLKLGGNLLFGPLDPCLAKLVNLEMLDLHGNRISALPSNFGNLSRLRILNINENEFEALPMDMLASLPLTDLSACKNQLKGTLIADSVTCLPTLRTLDVSFNRLTHLVSPGGASLPALHQLSASMNRLQALPDLTSWTNLVTLSVAENSIACFPEFAQLKKLRSVDLSSNDIRVVPAEVGLMDSLVMLRLSGNPLRDKKFATASTEELKEALALRLQPISDTLECPTRPGSVYMNMIHAIGEPPTARINTDGTQSDTDNFATPPTSVPNSPLPGTCSPVLKARSSWPVTSNGMLDRSGTKSSSLHPVQCSKVAAAHKIGHVQLHHNLFTTLPDSLSFFADTLTTLSLAHNELAGESYFGSERLDLPVLTELNLSSNRITALAQLMTQLRAPSLVKLDVSCNRILVLPRAGGDGSTVLRDAFPRLEVFLAANNHLVELEPDSIRGLRVVDVTNNEIEHLNPRIGLLAVRPGANTTVRDVPGLEKLDVAGNRFRVPRWDVLDRGTEVTLRWLRTRVPVAELGAWGELEEVD